MYLKEGRIDISDNGIIYWANKIKCNPNDLKKAICNVGDSYNVIILYLELNRQINRD